MEKIKPYLQWVLLGVIALTTWQATRTHRALLDAQRDAEAAQLALKNQIVENQETRRQLQGSVADLLSENTDLRAAYDRAKSAAPDAQPASATRLDTGPLRVHGPPAGAAVAAATGGAVSSGPAAPPVGPKHPVNPCLLRSEDEVSVEALVLELQTDKQNTIVVGSATVYREGAPRIALASGAFQSSLSTAHEVAAPAAERWGAELAGLCVAQGCSYGPGVLFPPFRVPLVGWRAEARADAFVGASPGVAGALGARW